MVYHDWRKRERSLQLTPALVVSSDTTMGLIVVTAQEESQGL